MSDLLKEAQYYGKQTRNEAAERLLETLERRKIALLTQSEQYEIDAAVRIVSRALPEALAAERRATVERIEPAIKAIAEHERYDLQYSREVTRLARDVAAYLDEEAAQ